MPILPAAFSPLLGPTPLSPPLSASLARRRSLRPCAHFFFCLGLGIPYLMCSLIFSLARSAAHAVCLSSGRGGGEIRGRGCGSSTTFKRAVRHSRRSDTFTFFLLRPPLLHACSAVTCLSSSGRCCCQCACLGCRFHAKIVRRPHWQSVGSACSTVLILWTCYFPHDVGAVADGGGQRRSRSLLDSIFDTRRPRLCMTPSPHGGIRAWSSAHLAARRPACSRQQLGRSKPPPSHNAVAI